MNTATTTASRPPPLLTSANSRMLLDSIEAFYSNPVNRAEFEDWRKARNNQPCAASYITPEERRG